MEGNGVPPFWPDTVCALRSDSGLDVLVPDMEALHTLSETMGATTVRTTEDHLVYKALIGLQHNTSALHGPHLLHCLFPLVPVL